MFKYLLCYFGSLLVLMVIYVGGLAIGTDLFSNKILVGAKLQPVQGWLLGVDDSYVTEGYVGWLDDNAAPDGNDMDREELSQVSLRYHSQSRVDDAMYRVYRDGAARVLFYR
jgi:hypothetical protein